MMNSIISYLYLKLEQQKEDTHKAKLSYENRSWLSRFRYRFSNTNNYSFYMGKQAVIREMIMELEKGKQND